MTDVYFQSYVFNFPFIILFMKIPLNISFSYRTDTLYNGTLKIHSGDCSNEIRISKMETDNEKVDL